MKKFLTLALLLTSTTAFAVGDVYEKGSAGQKNVICDPPTERVGGAPLPIDELQRVDVVFLNEDTGISETRAGLKDCNVIVNLDNMTVGQYNVTGIAYDTDNRVSVPSEPFYFLLIPTINPPNAPTGIKFQ